jgi:hypothetical protein
MLILYMEKQILLRTGICFLTLGHHALIVWVGDMLSLKMLTMFIIGFMIEILETA